MRPMPLKNLTFLISFLLVWVSSAADQRFTEFHTIDGFHGEPIIEIKSLDDPTTSTTTETIPADRRVDCSPDGAEVSLCKVRKCILDERAPPFVPMCYFPRNTGYRMLRSESHETMLEKAPGTGCPFGKDIPLIYFKFRTIKGSTLNVRIGPKNRFEPKLDLPRNVYDTGERFDVLVSNEAGIFSFLVQRHSTKATIWDTSIGGLLFADQYVQIAAFLGSSEIYGIGENVHRHLRHDVEQYTTWALLARDNSPHPYPAYIDIENTRNMHGVYPFLMALEEDNKAHGLLILNTNPQDITIGPAPHIVYRTIGGILDLYFFPGPLPEDVIRQYLAFVGTPMLPAYWALGFQLGSLGYKSLIDLQTAIKATQEAGIPLDVPFADLGYLSRAQDFTLASGWEGFPAYVEQLQNESLHIIVVLEPGVQADGNPFKRALQEEASFVEWAKADLIQRTVQDLYPLAKKTKVMLGVLRPDKHVAYPDFTTPETKRWWRNELRYFYEEITYDGVWLTANEPSSLGTNEDKPKYWYDHEHTNITSLHCPIKGPSAKYDMPTYETQNVYHYMNPNAPRKQRSYLASTTLCMSAMTKQGRMYGVKNLYGLQQTIATRSAIQKITKKRGVLITRSSYVSGGRYAGHSLGHNYASWEDMAASVVAVQEFNMFGIPYVGADICGFAEDTTEELCLRWQQLGAFYTLSRNRNDDKSTPQEPTAWSSVANATAAANLFRYGLLPYLYTLMFEAARNGATVIRPLFFEFPDDDAAHQNNFQFLWGPAVLIAPVLDEGVESVYVYLPRNATWYSLRDDFGVKARNGFSFLLAPSNRLPPVFLRGGYIIPRQEGGQTTAATRRHPFQLVVAVENSMAHGKLIWDDGESIIKNFKEHEYIELLFNFTMKETASRLTLRLVRSSSSFTAPNITFLTIIGHNATPIVSSIRKEPGGLKVMSGTSYDSDKHIFYLNASSIFNFTTDSEVFITWSNDVYGTSWAVPVDQRVNCLPDSVSKSFCAIRDCVLDANPPFFVPICYFPRNTGYTVLRSEPHETILTKAPGTGCPFGKDIARIYFKYKTIKGSTLNVRIGYNGRYEPKLDLPRNVYDTGERFDVLVSNEAGIFSFLVQRHSTRATIWDTSIGGLLFADQYVQIAAFLGSSEIYGIGENVHRRLRHDVEQYTTWALLARDNWPHASPAHFGSDNTENLYGVYPFLMGFEEDNSAHGLLILNSNPQDITIGPAPHIVYRTIGGILDLYFFPGPLPEDVIRQYLAFVGTPMLPAYWALGFQLGSLGYKSVEDMRNVVDETRKAGIPLDVPFADLQYLSRAKDFTMASGWEEFPSYVQQLHKNSMHVILVLFPAVQADGDPFKRALEEDASFVEWERNDMIQRTVQGLYPVANKTKVMLGVLRPDKHVAYADFTTSETKYWWKDELRRFYKSIPFDGLSLIRNEPASLGTNDNKPDYWSDPEHTKIMPLHCPFSGPNAKYDKPPYETANVYQYLAPKHRAYLASMTLCMSAMTKQGRMYDVKNLYGLQQTMATYSAMQKITKKRPVLITRSSYLSGGRYAGHSLGHNYASWEDMSASVVAIQEFNMFGIPYVGADICGYAEDTTKELCLRWQQLGAFYTLSRNRNDDISMPQHPTEWPDVATATAAANLLRYSLLPYLYTLMFEAARNGATVIRPLFFEFPNDDAAHQNNFQFLWGPAILIAPVLDKGSCVTILKHIFVYAYLPRDATWYSLRDDFGVKVQSGFSFIPAPPNRLPPVFLRGGYIIPRQKGALTTTATRRHPFQLVIAVENSNAFGKLIWDDGESIVSNIKDHKYIELHFNFTMNSITSQLNITRVRWSASISAPDITSVTVFGHSAVPVLSTIRRGTENFALSSQTSHDFKRKIFYLSASSIFNFATDSEVVISWSNNPTIIVSPPLDATTSATSNITSTISSTTPMQLTISMQQVIDSISTHLRTTTVSASNTSNTCYLITVFVCLIVLLW